MKANRSSSIGSSSRRRSSSTSAGPATPGSNSGSSKKPVVTAAEGGNKNSEQQKPEDPPRRRSTREREQPQLLTPGYPKQVYPSSSETPKSSRRRGRTASVSTSAGSTTTSSTAKASKVPTASDILAGTPELPLTPLVTEVLTGSKGRSSSTKATKRQGSPSQTLLSSPLSDIPELHARMKGKDIKVVLVVNGTTIDQQQQQQSVSIKSQRGTNTSAKGGKSAQKKAAPAFLGQDGNLFYCVVCQDVGDVVCCDGCPHVYHPKCLEKGSRSRTSLENDDDPWFCPECMDKKTPIKKEKEGTSVTGGSSSRRTIKHRCQECRQTRPGLDLEPCKVCGVHVHYPSCRGTPPSAGVGDGDSHSEKQQTTKVVLCSSCRAEAALTQEEIELQNKKHRRIVDEATASPQVKSSNEGAAMASVGSAPVLAETPVKEEVKGRRRTRSMDENENTPMADKNISAYADETVDAVASSSQKRKRSASDVAATPGGEEGTPKSERRKKKKKKKKKRDSDAHLPTEEGSTNNSSTTDSISTPTPVSNESPSQFTTPLQGPPTQATPAFHFYLSEQRPKVEKVLSRKHRYFNRLPKGGERNALIAKETAKQWIKLSSVDQKKYINMSMHDYESRIIAWKEEKNIRDMLAGATEGPVEPAEAVLDEDPDDSIVTYDMYERLYMGTSVGSKPYKPEPNQSHNRVLLDLLRDMRFHPLPMLSANRSQVELQGVEPSSKMVIKHFEVHGPIATSVGDECMGCTRGWPHFCPVLQRRIPATVQRSKLQPAASALIASRVGLGLRPRLERIEKVEENGTGEESREGSLDLLRWREAKESKDFKTVRFVPSATLSDPSNRADDVVEFIEKVVAMKIPEPPKPSAPVKTEATPKKSSLTRGLPTRHKRTPETSTGDDAGEDNGYSSINKCGRCRTIIMNDSGCVQCRRAQLVINMSRRESQAKTEDGGDQKNEKEDIMTVQTAMLCRVVTKEAIIGEPQVESDKKICKALLKTRWTPCAILPPAPTLAPSPSRRSNKESEKSTGGSKQDNKDTLQPKTELPVNEDRNYPTLANEVTSPAQGSPEPSSDLRPRNARKKESDAFEHQEAGRQVTVKQHKKEAEKVMKRAVSIACSGILLALMRRDPFLLFAQPASAEGYHAVVKDPIDFGKIREKVLRGSYPKLSSFIADARLLCDNSFLFNPPGSIYWATAKDLLDILLVMHKRASKWINAIKNSHASYMRKAQMKREPEEPPDASNLGPFEELKEVWPEAVEMYENSDWLKKLLAADFTRTKENETAFYGSIAVRRAARAAEVCLAPYTDTGGAFSAVVKRSHIEDEELRNAVDSKVAKVVDSAQLREISSDREEGVVRLMRRVQNRRLERRIGSENGCARCDAMGLDHEVKAVMNADVRWGRSKKQGDNDSDARVAPSRLSLTTGLASANTRERIEKRREQTGEAAFESVDSCVSLKGSRVHGLGLFSEQFFKKGEVVCEYIGECVSLPVAERREKIYQAMRIQDYQFRLDDSQIIDATMNGGLGRYVNHNCNPNCMTKIIPGKTPNEKTHRRVLIIALRDIEPREELSYDYQFPLESNMEARIPCNCQSPLCRGFMNWDLPEKGANTGAIRTQKRGANMRDRIRRLGRPLKK